jgi:hypothetical protein
MHPQHYNKYDYKHKSMFWIFMPFVIFFIFLLPAIKSMPLWMAILIIILLFKVFRFHRFGTFHRHRYSNMHSKSHNTNLDHHNGWEVPISYMDETDVKPTKPTVILKSAEFCIECEIKLQADSKYCMNCGSKQ